MRTRWLGGVGLSLGMWIGAAAADDGWRPASPQSAVNCSASARATSGSLGVSLGRPVAMDAPSSTGLEEADLSAERVVTDTNLTRASYQQPAGLPPLVRLQSPEVPLPLPQGPTAKTGKTSANPVSKSTSGFATGVPTIAEPPVSAFASDHVKTDAPLEAVPAPQHDLVPEPAGVGVSSTTNCWSCDGSPCDALCCDPCCDPNRLYISGEYLLWWIKNDHLPPLVSTGVIGAPGTTVLFGNSLDHEERSGGRFTAGYWFDSEQTLALETTVFFLANRNGNFAANSGTFPVLARPFFNLNTGTEFAEITTGPGLGSGGISVNSFSRMWGAEINLRRNICDTCRWRFDVLGGFRYLSLREGINIQENILADAAAPMFPGDTIVVTDDFNTRNQFYGGQIGTRLGWTYNRWSIDWLAKVALGDTHQVVNIQGSQMVTTPAGATSFFNGGLLALPSNSGSFSRDQFAVVPETDLILGFRVTNHLRLLVGYSFLYWSNVVRPGNQIDRVVDVTNIPNTGMMAVPTGQNRPATLFKGSDFWAQGISFGMELVF